MRKFKNLMLVTLAVLFVSAIWAQEKTTQAYWVHQDNVKLAKTQDYESVAKELTALLTENNIQDETWLASSTSDGRYMYVTPIKNMGDLDKPIFKSLRAKVGDEKVWGLFGKMDKFYDSHTNYVIHLDKELSYMPNGITLTPEGENFREFHFLHFTPGNATEVNKHMKVVKDMFANKGSKVHYRVYRTGFGAPSDYYMVAVAAKDPVDMAQKGADNDKLLGEEGDKTFGALFGNLSKYEKVEGRIRPDLGYSPKKDM